MPKAIGRVSRRRDAARAAASAAPMKVTPISTRVSSGPSTSGQCVSALNRSGRNRLRA